MSARYDYETIYKFEDLQKLSSKDLINLLADLGHGPKYVDGMDTRTAKIYETGTFTYSGVSYAKIVVTYDSGSKLGALWDYGVRLIIQKIQVPT
jgi:hypothetical protein